jgi:hypothetical protein
VLTIWKASAINAKDPTTNPTPNSSTKNAASIASIIEMRVDFDHAILKGRRWGVLGRTRRCNCLCCVLEGGKDPTFHFVTEMSMRLLKLVRHRRLLYADLVNATAMFLWTKKRRYKEVEQPEERLR